MGRDLVAHFHFKYSNRANVFGRVFDQGIDIRRIRRNFEPIDVTLTYVSEVVGKTPIYPFKLFEMLSLI